MVRRISRPCYLCAAALLLGAIGPSGCVQRVASAPIARASGDPVADTVTVPPAEPVFAAGTTVAGVEVGGETAARAGHLVRLAHKPLAARNITLRDGQKMFPRTWSDLGIAPDVDAMLARAWTEPDVPLMLDVSLAIAKASIRRAALALDVPPVAPRFVAEPVESEIRPGRPGRRVEVHASALRLRSLIAKDPDAGEVELVVRPAAPPFSVAHLRAIRRPVVTFSTRFNPRERDRTHNLRLVAQRLDGALVPPGAVFSFNDWVGERKPSDGFREAIVFKEGKMVKDTAGGLCQVSSTLYNVALLAGLPIVERTQHSLTVTYVPLGRDAAVYWGQKDLRFRNDTDGPLYIRARTGRSTLTVEAWGAGPLGRKVMVTNRVARRHGKAHAQAYRSITENGTTRRERLSSDTYETVHRMASTRSRAR